MLRFAPSPTGDMQIADLRVALANYIVAKQRAEGFLLRIEDTDKSRNVEGKDAEIKDLLAKFAIHPDQVLYQSDTLNRYQQLALHLVAEEKAFLCLCSEEDIERERRKAEDNNQPYRYSGRCTRLSPEEIRRIRDKKIPFTIRIRKPDEAILFTDLIREEIRAEPAEVDHFTLLRSDGTPTHNFACAVDDMSEGIRLVIRDEKHLMDTPKQIHIRRSLGFDEEIVYAHLPPLLDESGRRMPKAENSSVKWLLEAGFLPDAVINYLLAPGCEACMDEVFTLPDAIECFDLQKFSRSEARFDLDCLRRLNRKHLRRMNDRELSRIFGFADVEIGRLAKLYLQEAATINELDTKLHAIFAPKRCDEEWGPQMRSLSDAILSAPYFEAFDAFANDLSERTGLEGETLLQPLRQLMTGARHGPQLSDVYQHIKSYITEVARCQH